MGLFDAKYCSICATKIGLLGGRKLADGILCKDCAKKLSPLFSDRRESTVAQIQAQLEYREANKADVAAFKPSKLFELNRYLFVDEENGTFLVNYRKAYENDNPDVIRLSQITGFEPEYKETKKEVKGKDAEGKEFSYKPPRWETEYEIGLNVKIDSPWFDEVSLKIGDDIVIPSVGNQPVEPFMSEEYRNAYVLMQEVENALLPPGQQRPLDVPPIVPRPGETVVSGADGAGSGALANASPIQSFYYAFDGSGNSYSYEVDALQDPPVFSYTARRYQDYGRMTNVTNELILARLKNLCDKYKIEQWSGFSKSAQGVLDGSGFTLTIGYADGTNLYARGTNAFPPRYGEFTRELDVLFTPLVTKVVADNKSRNVAGSLNSIMASFRQQGASGADSYEVLIFAAGLRSMNFDVTIRSDSGEFIERGVYRYRASLPNEAIRLGEFRNLIERYELVKWTGWDQTAPNFTNCESFQIDFAFEEGNIAARGTLHPEHYAEFRADFLRTLVAVIRNAKTYYGLREL